MMEHHNRWDCLCGVVFRYPTWHHINCVFMWFSKFITINLNGKQRPSQKSTWYPAHSNKDIKTRYRLKIRYHHPSVFLEIIDLASWQSYLLILNLSISLSVVAHREFISFINSKTKQIWWNWRQKKQLATKLDKTLNYSQNMYRRTE